MKKQLAAFKQRKVFSRQKVMLKRLAKGDCVVCSKKLPPGAKACPFCGARQLHACAACSRETPIGGPFCIHCGAPKTN